MMRDITIGQYYPADSILHRLDPRVKFVSTLVYIISLFVFSSWVGIWSGGTVSGGDDRSVKSPVWIYGKGIKADHGAVTDHDVL